MNDRLRAIADDAGLHGVDDALGSLAVYVQLLSNAGARANLVGTTDPARIVDELVADAFYLAQLLPRRAHRVIDVGSGAGLPGIPLAILRTDLDVTLLEPRKKRYHFLRHARRALALHNIEVERGRLEEIDADVRFDVAMARAVFSPDEWLRRASELIEPTGSIVLFGSGRAVELVEGLADSDIAEPAGRCDYTVRTPNGTVARSIVLWKRPTPNDG